MEEMKEKDELKEDKESPKTQEAEDKKDDEQDKKLEGHEESDESKWEELNKELDSLEKEIAELREYKKGNESGKFLKEHKVKEHLHNHVRKLLEGHDNPEEGVKELKRDAPEFFEDEGSKINDHFTPKKKDESENKDKYKIDEKDLKNKERELGY